MAEGSKLHARFQATDLYLQPDRSSVRDELMGVAGVGALHVMVLLLRSKRLGLGRPMVLEVWCMWE